MAVYSVRGVAGVVAANGVAAQLWNPSSTRRIKVVELFWGMFGDTGASQLRWLVQRSSARGATPNNTVTPDADNADDAAAVPPSASVLEMGPFVTGPTLASPPLYSPLTQTMAATATQSCFLAPFPRGIWVPPGAGLCIVAVSTETFTNQEASFVFED